MTASRYWGRRTNLVYQSPSSVCRVKGLAPPDYVPPMLSIDDTVKWKVYDAIAMMETSLDNGGIPVESVDSSSCTASLEPTERTGSWLRNCCCPRHSSELRLWTVLHAVLTASIMTFLVGITLAFSSPALLELTQLQDLQFRFNTGLADLFGVKLKTTLYR